MVCSRSFVRRLAQRLRAAAARAPAADGFVLVAVLWILGGLATLAGIYAVYVVNAAAGMSVDRDRLQAEASMSGAVELTAYYLGAVEPATRPSSGTFTFQLGGRGIAVSFVSEAARIDLNTAPKTLLAGLFRGLGAAPDDAEYYADRIEGWRKPSDVEIESRDKEIAAYRAAGLAYDPRQPPSTACRSSGWCSGCRRLWSSAPCLSSPCSAACPPSTSSMPRPKFLARFRA